MHILAKFNTFSRRSKPISQFNTFDSAWEPRYFEEKEDEFHNNDLSPFRKRSLLKNELSLKLHIDQTLDTCFCRGSQLFRCSRTLHPPNIPGFE